MQNILRVEGLVKRYNTITAVDNISFDVEKGSFFAFLGVNGAGKSTTINILSTLTEKNEGKVFFDGLDLDNNFNDIRKQIGIVFQHSVLDKTLNVKDNLMSRGSLYGLYGKTLKERVSELTETFNLSDILKQTYSTLSGGQRRRVDIARAIINKPKLLFLDEPTTGLDPQNRILVWDIINHIKETQNTTLFLTTHYMEETKFADKIAVIDKGKIIECNTPLYLKNKYTGIYLKINVKQSLTLDKKLFPLGFDFKDKAYLVKLKNQREALNLLNQDLKNFSDFEIIKGDMDDVFLNITGKELH